MEAIGILLIVTSIPLILRWVPRNRFFGFRIPATLRDDSIWYDVNALSARHMLVLGLLLVGLEFVLPEWMRTWVLRVIATGGFFGIIIADWRTANRWARERSTGIIEHRLTQSRDVQQLSLNRVEGCKEKRPG